MPLLNLFRKKDSSNIAKAKKTFIHDIMPTYDGGKHKESEFSFADAKDGHVRVFLNGQKTNLLFCPVESNCPTPGCFNNNNGYADIE